MQRFPLLAQTGKPVLPMNGKAISQLQQQLGGQLITIERSAKALADRGPGLVDNSGSIDRHVDVDTHTNDNMTDICRIPGQFQENPGYLATIDQHVVRPFESRAVDATALQSSSDRKPDSQTQGFHLTHATVYTQNDTAVKVLGKRTGPDAPPPTTPSSLTLSKQNERCTRSRIEAAKDLGIGGVNAGLDSDRPIHAFSTMRYLPGIEQSHGRRQPIASARNLEHLDPQLSLQALQLLPDGTATYPKRRPKGFTGMESTILQKFQQFQHARPRYEQGWHDNDEASACIENGKQKKAAQRKDHDRAQYPTRKNQTIKIKNDKATFEMAFLLMPTKQRNPARTGVTASLQVRTTH